MATLPAEERKKILEAEITKYVGMKWRIISRTDTTAQLVRDKPPSCLVALILALFLIIPAILYLMFYKGTESLYLQVDENGKVSTQSQ